MSKQKIRVGIIGSGSWATALAKLLHQNIECINWYFRKKSTIESFQNGNHNPRYLRSVDFDVKRINFHDDINILVEDSDIILMAVPSAFLPIILQDLNQKLSDKLILSGIKGIVTQENLLIVEYLNSVFDVPFENIGILAGPCHAEEIALEKLSYLTVACQNKHNAQLFANLLSCDYMFTSISDDIWGTEYASVIKNIIAIASGITHGLRYGDNFHAVLVSNAIQEIKRFVDAVHPITRDIKSSAYLGDLMVTSYSQFSRNRMFGTMIGKGYSVKNAQLEMNMVAEGYYAALSIFEINKNYRVEMPISNSVYKILYEGVSPEKEIKVLTKLLT